MPIKLARTLLLGLILAAVLASTGCVEFERVITLNKDLSGKATFRMAVNMEAMARIVAATHRQGTGESAVATNEEIAVAAKELMARQPPPDMKTAVGTLPAGFVLLDATQRMGALTMNVSVTIAFDDVRKLPTFKITDPSAAGANDKKDQLQPFEGIEVKDEGATVLLIAKLLTTGDSKMLAPGAPPGGDRPAPEGLTDAIREEFGTMGRDAKAQVDSVLKDMKETFRVETPMTVVDTNATTRVPGAFLWAYTMEALAKAKAASADARNPVMTIRMKK